MWLTGDEMDGGLDLYYKVKKQEIMVKDKAVDG